MNDHKKPPDLTPPGNTAAAGSQKKEAKPAKEPKAPKEPKVPRESNFKKLYPDAATVHVITPEKKNPKRAGTKSFDRFALYSTTKNVGEFIKAGGLYADLSWDVGHGFIRVDKPAA